MGAVTCLQLYGGGWGRLPVYNSTEEDGAVTCLQLYRGGWGRLPVYTSTEEDGAVTCLQLYRGGWGRLPIYNSTEEDGAVTCLQLYRGGWGRLHVYNSTEQDGAVTCLQLYGGGWGGYLSTTLQRRMGAVTCLQLYGGGWGGYLLMEVGESGYLGVLPARGLRVALKETKPVMMEKIAQMTMNLHQPNFIHRPIGMSHMPSSVATCQQTNRDEPVRATCPVVWPPVNRPIEMSQSEPHAQ